MPSAIWSPSSASPPILANVFGSPKSVFWSSQKSSVSEEYLRALDYWHRPLDASRRRRSGDANIPRRHEPTPPLGLACVFPFTVMDGSL